MAIVNMENIKALFNNEISAENKRQALKELLILVLARGSRADLHIHESEVATAQKVIKVYTGEDISAAELRVAASSEIFEKAPLNKHVSRVASSIDGADRIIIIHALKEVLKADGHVRQTEIDFFNTMAGALKLKPSEIAGISLG
ncbi:TerB family tellurite resistance protein [Microbulbifer sp. SA54]|uniref:TerB family tellurite resistance protein n=1 Tax=Microbulbifer sp. SA54 TaxID=3401577 RepID=UPI003AADF1EE